MIAKTDDLVGSLIHDVAHLLRLHIDERLQPFRLTRVHWLAIGIIGENERLTQAELANKLELGAATTGKLVDRLEERGLVRRENDPNDRRSNLLALTPDAKAILRKLARVSKELRQEILCDLSETEQERLKRSLLKIKKQLTQERSQVA